MGILSRANHTVQAVTTSEAPQPDGWDYGMLATGVAITLVIVLMAVLYLKSWFPKYFHKTVSQTFDEMDMDRSGKIEKAELYAAVLRLYLNLNRYIKVRAPPKENIMTLCESVDVGEGGLDREEFHKLAKVLSKQIMGRATIQTVLHSVAPLTGGTLWRFATYTAEQTVGENPWIQLFPDSVVENCPPSLPPTIFSSLFMLSLPFFFDLMDRHSVQDAKAAAKELKKVR